MRFTVFLTTKKIVELFEFDSLMDACTFAMALSENHLGGNKDWDVRIHFGEK